MKFDSNDDEFFGDIIPGVGKLYKEIVFFEYDSMPMLFVLHSTDGAKYLCLTTDTLSDQEAYLITPLSTPTLIDLIHGAISINGALERSLSGKWYLITGTEDSYDVTITNQYHDDKLDHYILGSALKFDSRMSNNIDDLEAYIEYLQKMND